MSPEFIKERNEGVKEEEGRRRRREEKEKRERGGTVKAKKTRSEDRGEYRVK
jgi:hypothetical protein